MPAATSVKLYVLGTIDRSSDAQQITVFAEFREARGLSRVRLDKAKTDTLFQEIENLRGFVEGGAPQLTTKSLRQLGGKLQDLLLVGKTRELFTHATAVAKSEGISRLPLEIIAEDYEIAGWPWEYLYDNERGFVSQDFHPISRSIFSIQSAATCPPIQGKIKILLILGVTSDDPHISSKDEVAIISDIFSTHLADDKFEIKVFDAKQRSKLVLELQNQEYHIVHFFGHAGFDTEDGTGYLAFARPDSKPFRIPADNFANILSERGIRLVFLNACKTAQGAPTESPGRSSVAGALLARGIPAVVGAQFSLPEQSAHYLAATVYNALLTGKPIGEAMRDGRNSMGIADAAQFFDWGIPVLYAKDSAVTIFPLKGKRPSWANPFEDAVSARKLIEPSRVESGAPSVVVERTRERRGAAKVTVALIDLDAKVAFLPDLAEEASRAQTYYHFSVAYLPVPAGYVREDIGNRPQTYLPRLNDYLGSLPDALAVDFVCCITRNPVAGKEGGAIFSEHFAAELDSNEKVFVISTADLREYALAAETTLQKAVFRLFLSMIIDGDGSLSHKETAGCLFDYCDARADIVMNLKNPIFNHTPCREKIKDKKQLSAIDALVALTAPGQKQSSEPKRTKPAAKEKAKENPAVSGGEIEVMRTMRDNRFKRRTVKGIVQDTGMTAEKVERLLAKLIRQGYVGEVRSKDQQRYLYRLLPRGLVALEGS